MTDQDALEVWADRTVREALRIDRRFRAMRFIAFLGYFCCIAAGLWFMKSWLCLASVPFGLWHFFDRSLFRGALHKMRGEQQLWLLRNVRNAALREQVTADLENKY